MTQADLVLYGGKVWTGMDRTATAIAVRDGRILAVGDDAAMRGMLASDGDEVDLEGRLVLPGLIDAHVHLKWFARSLREVNLSNARSEKESAELVRAWATTTPPGEWILGRGWAQSQWPGEAFPTAASLDAVAPNNPVCLNAYSGHALWVNSAALKLAGVTAETPDPPGGQILRDGAGNPLGVFTEDAMDLVTRLRPEPSARQLAEWIEPAIMEAHCAGLTGIHDFDDADCLPALQILRDEGKLTLRIVKNIPILLMDQAIDVGLRWGFGDDLLRIGGVKSFADGALGVQTALMVDPYETDPTNTGIRVIEPGEMLENVRKASVAGLPSAIHGIGDLAVREILDVFAIVRKEEDERGAQLRHRIEHVQLIHPEDAHRLGEMGIIASMQPSHATSDIRMADTHWGNRADWGYAWRVQLQNGATLAFGSDAPIEPMEPLRGIHAAVTRRRADGSPGPEGWRSQNNARLTVAEAVRGFSEGPAYAAGMEDRLGRLAPGYLADLTVLNRDIFDCEPMAILETNVVGTMVGGKWVHRAF